MTVDLRFNSLEEALLRKFGNVTPIHAEWHTEACVTLWLLDEEGEGIKCRFNRGLSGLWTLIPLEGCIVGGERVNQQ